MIRSERLLREAGAMISVDCFFLFFLFHSQAWNGASRQDKLDTPLRVGWTAAKDFRDLGIPSCWEGEYTYQPLYPLSSETVRI